MSRTAPSSRGFFNQKAEDEKKYKKALRFIYRYGQEGSKLTDEAAEACKKQGINPEDLTLKQLSDFTEMGSKTTTGMLNKSDSGMSSHHIIQ